MFSFITLKLLYKLFRSVNRLLKGQHHMGVEFDRLKAEVAEMSAKVDEVVEFIRANAGDPAALNAFADELDADQAKLDAGMAKTPPVEPPVV